MVNDPVAALRHLVDTEGTGADVTCVAGPAIGVRAVIESGVGIIAGSLPDEILDDVLADADELVSSERSQALDYGEHRVFIAAVTPRPVLVVFGAGHVSQTLAVFANHLGYRVIVVDARPAWATADRFPDVDELIVGWPDDFFEGHELDARTYVALMNHDARFEDPVLERVRNAPIRYLGAMGSRRTHRKRVERLVAAGWAQTEVDRIHGPIGLDIGGETPEEMALAIAAEITEVRYGRGTSLSLRGTTGRIHRTPADGSTDPNDTA